MQIFDKSYNNFFYSNCIIAEIRDYRIASSSESYDVHFVILNSHAQVFCILIIFYLIICYICIINRLKGAGGVVWHQHFFYF